MIVFLEFQVLTSVLEDYFKVSGASLLCLCLMFLVFPGRYKAVLHLH